MTIKNRYPLPLMSSAFEILEGAKIFTKLDLRNAYHFVRIKEGDEWKTGFNTPLGHFEYRGTSVRACQRSSCFSALVNDVLRDMLNILVFVYLDDILIFSNSLQEHVLHVRRVLQRLLENRLFVKAEKCVFMPVRFRFGFGRVHRGHRYGSSQGARCYGLACPRLSYSSPKVFWGLLIFIVALSVISVRWPPLLRPSRRPSLITRGPTWPRRLSIALRNYFLPHLSW